MTALIPQSLHEKESQHESCYAHAHVFGVPCTSWKRLMAAIWQCLASVETSWSECWINAPLSRAGRCLMVVGVPLKLVAEISCGNAESPLNLLAKEPLHGVLMHHIPPSVTRHTHHLFTGTLHGYISGTLHDPQGLPVAPKLCNATSCKATVYTVQLTCSLWNLM